MATQPKPLSPAQAKFIGSLATQLGYATVRDMWREYGYIEQTPWGDKPRFVSMSAASNLITTLKRRVADLSTGESES